MTQAAPAEVLPCPFCGGDAFVERADYSSCYVICNDCSARGPVSCDETEADADASENDDVDPGELPARRLWNTRPETPSTRLAGGRELRRIRTSMALLQQQAEGCATNHYGNDHELHGMPGWLADTRRDLDALTALLAREGEAADA